MPSRRHLLVQCASAFSLAALPALAQSGSNAPDVVPVRGTVETASPDGLVLRSARGQTLAVQLTGNWQALAVFPSALSAVKRGDFIATATAGRGNHVAIRVLVILSPALRDVGQGHYHWNFGPAYLRDDAIVDALVLQVYRNEITISWSGGEKQLVIPDGLPVVRLEPGDRAMVAPGAKVFLFATLNGGHALARYVLVGANGFTPPM
ncbi:MAG TPA: hypothetical protein VJ779_06330 [Acetobacteraceae bacterium]|nr:hypothetical protein [Acetobacteraceae bacterium]